MASGLLSDKPCISVQGFFVGGHRITSIQMFCGKGVPV